MPLLIYLGFRRTLSMPNDWDWAATTANEAMIIAHDTTNSHSRTVEVADRTETIVVPKAKEGYAKNKARENSVKIIVELVEEEIFWVKKWGVFILRCSREVVTFGGTKTLKVRLEWKTNTGLKTHPPIRAPPEEARGILGSA